MPDITMCSNEKCTLRKFCYRQVAIPNPYAQDYSHFEQDENEECEHFIDVFEKFNDSLDVPKEND